MQQVLLFVSFCLTLTVCHAAYTSWVCSAPEVPGSMTIGHARRRYRYASTVVFRCAPGFRTKGALAFMKKCSRANTWAPEGFGSFECEDFDECAQRNPCSGNSRCVNTPGGFTCECPEGFVRRGYRCYRVTTPGVKVSPNVRRGRVDCKRPDLPRTMTATPYRERYGYGSRVTLMCRAQYRKFGRMSVTKRCTGQDRWTNLRSGGELACAPADDPQVKTAVAPIEGKEVQVTTTTAPVLTGRPKMKTCPRPEVPKTMKLASGKRSFAYGRIAVFQCAKGFSAHGRMSFLKRCSRAGTWFPSLFGHFECMDVDECAKYRSPCSGDARCVNTEGSYRCTCRKGFHSKGSRCYDTNECASGEHGCDQNAICRNTRGGYTCTCRLGHVGDGFSCKIRDDCGSPLTNNCSANATCTNHLLGHKCLCNEGFRGNGIHCYDKAQCSPAIAMQCSENADCELVSVGFRCTCRRGFLGNGFYCRDVDECHGVDRKCHAHAQCINTVGSFACVCNTGFEGDGFDCGAVNECASPDTFTCSEFANCVDTFEGYKCECLDGFAGDGKTCHPKEECDLSWSNVCDENAQCWKADGSVECSCLDGYEGNGLECADLNECEEFPCHENANCLNTDGSFLCRCSHGFVGNGFSCEQR